MPQVTDGASLRKRRLLELVGYIKSCNPDGASTLDCQSMMMAKFGLKFDTTSRYLHDLHAGGWICIGMTKEGAGRWFVTKKVVKLAGWLYSEE